MLDVHRSEVTGNGATRGDYQRRVFLARLVTHRSAWSVASHAWTTLGTIQCNFHRSAACKAFSANSQLCVRYRRNDPQRIAIHISWATYDNSTARRRGGQKSLAPRLRTCSEVAIVDTTWPFLTLLCRVTDRVRCAAVLPEAKACQVDRRLDHSSFAGQVGRADQARGGAIGTRCWH
jgi:hypothetical protein